MQGSLENPPMIVREAWLLPIVIAMVVAGITVVLMLPDGSGLWQQQPFLTGVLLACAWGFCLWRFRRPPRLEIWPDKLVRVDFAGFRHSYPFADIDEFTVTLMRRSGMAVVFSWTKDSPRRTKLAALSEAVDGYDVSLGGYWEMSAQDLADLLNRTRLLPSAWRG